MGPKLQVNKLDKSFETLARIQDNITGLDIESSFILEMYVIYINVILFFFFLLNEEKKKVQISNEDRLMFKVTMMSSVTLINKYDYQWPIGKTESLFKH